MKMHFRDTGPFKAEAWVEDYGQVVCTAKLIVVPDETPRLLVDTLDTLPAFRRRGYAKTLILALQQNFASVEPATIDNNPTAKAFWASLGMKAALGDEEDFDDADTLDANESSDWNELEAQLEKED